MNVEVSKSIVGEILEYRGEKYIVTSYNPLNSQAVLTKMDDINRLNIRSIIGASEFKNNYKSDDNKIQYIYINGRTYKKIPNDNSFTLEPIEGEYEPEVSDIERLINRIEILEKSIDSISNKLENIEKLLKEVNNG